MRYPKLLCKGDTIGVCAPSGGVPEHLWPRLDKAVENVQALGYNVIVTESVRGGAKCVSADSITRAAEFMRLYKDPAVAAIIPPWGGYFLMDMLPHIDLAHLAQLPPKWICGYSDLTSLTFALTLCCDIATVHGSNFMNMGYAGIHASDMKAYDIISNENLTQHNSSHWGTFTSWSDLTQETYTLTEKTKWKALDNAAQHTFEGRMIGGCMDTLRILFGTRFAPVPAFLEKYKRDGFIWTLESCEMHAATIYRTLWQMRELGWFQYCNGVLIGRPDRYSDSGDFTLVDALDSGLGSLGVPVIYDIDIGHIPPQMQIINGAYGRVEYANGGATVTQHH